MGKFYTGGSVPSSVPDGWTCNSSCVSWFDGFMLFIMYIYEQYITVDLNSPKGCERQSFLFMHSSPLDFAISVRMHVVDTRI